jgi:hypothetical protein
MSVETDKVPPVPEHTPPLKENEIRPEIGKYFSQTWTRWFVSLRDKINIIDESIVNLAGVSGSGVLVKNGVAWLLRTITGTANRVTVTNGSGAGGDPTIDVVTADLVAGTNVSFSGSGVGRIIGTTNLTINASGGGGGSSSAGILVTAGDKSGSVLPVGFEVSGISTATYALTGNWYFWCYPSGSIEIDVWLDTFANVPPVVGDSIVGAAYPAISAGISDSGDYTSWTDTSIARGDALTISIRSVTDVTWFSIMFEATR